MVGIRGRCGARLLCFDTSEKFFERYPVVITQPLQRREGYAVFADLHPTDVHIQVETDVFLRDALIFADFFQPLGQRLRQFYIFLFDAHMTKNYIIVVFFYSLNGVIRKFSILLQRE